MAEQISFLESPRFPEDISYGSSGGPEYKTNLVTITSGFETRNQSWQNARHKYDVSYGIRDANSVRKLLAFFHQCRGKLLGFRYKDWNDYTAVDQPVIWFQFTLPLTSTQVSMGHLIKAYGEVGSSQFCRKISKPVEDTVTIKKNGVPYTEFTVDYTTGMLTNTGADFVEGDIVTWSGEFDVPVRFDDDYLSVSLDNYTLSSTSVNLIEIRL